MWLINNYKGDVGVKAGPMSYAAISIKFAEAIKTMQQGYKL